MIVTIIPEDGVVIVDGRMAVIDMVGVPEGIHAVQFAGTSTTVGSGWIEYKDRTIGNEPISNITDFVFLYSRYVTAISRQDAATDPYFEATVASARELKYSEISKLANTARRNNQVTTSGTLSESGSQALGELLAYSLSCVATGEGSMPIFVILADLNPDGTPKRVELPASAVVEHIKTMKGRNEEINQLEQDAKDDITLLNDVVAIKEYVVTVSS